MLNEAQNISTGVPIQIHDGHDGHVHHEAPCCSLFGLYFNAWNVPNGFVFQIWEKGHFLQHGTYWFLSRFGYKSKTKICEILKRSVHIITEIAKNSCLHIILNLRSRHFMNDSCATSTALQFDLIMVNTIIPARASHTTITLVVPDD